MSHPAQVGLRSGLPKLSRSCRTRSDRQELALVDRRRVRAVGVDAGDPAHQATALLSVVRLAAREGKVSPCDQGFALALGFCHSTGGNSARSKEFRDGKRMTGETLMSEYGAPSDTTLPATCGRRWPYEH